MSAEVIDNIVYISGELSFETVPTLDRSNRILIERNPKVIFDLSKVTFSDNAGVALLVVLAGYAKSLGREISFINLPKQLLDLLSAVKLKEVLPIS